MDGHRCIFEEDFVMRRFPDGLVSSQKSDLFRVVGDTQQSDFNPYFGLSSQATPSVTLIEFDVSERRLHVNTASLSQLYPSFRVEIGASLGAILVQGWINLDCSITCPAFTETCHGTSTTVYALVHLTVCRVSVIAFDLTSLQEAERSPFGAPVVVTAFIIDEVFLPVWIGQILPGSFEMEGVVLQVIADLLLGQKDIIFFTAKGTIPHHQLRQLPNDLFSMIHVRNECVTLRGLLLMQCIIENELPLRADQDVIAGKELAVFHAEGRGIDISPGVAV